MQNDFAMIAKHPSGKGFRTKKAKRKAELRRIRQAILEGPVIEEDEREQ